jgi:hypothetical protein
MGVDSSYHFVGGKTVTLSNLAGGETLEFSGEFTLVIAASCTVGTINVYGNVRVVNNTGGATVNNYTERWQMSELTGNILLTGAVQTVYTYAVGDLAWHQVVKVDLSLQAAADTVIVTWTEDGVIVDRQTFAGAQAIPLKRIALDPTSSTVLVTIQQTAGAAFNVPYSAVRTLAV